jgi:hypothetical protein
MLHGYGYVYRYPIRDMPISKKKPDTWIRLNYFFIKKITLLVKLQNRYSSSPKRHPRSITLI